MPAIDTWKRPHEKRALRQSAIEWDWPLARCGTDTDAWANRHGEIAENYTAKRAQSSPTLHFNDVHPIASRLRWYPAGRTRGGRNAARDGVCSTAAGVTTGDLDAIGVAVRIALRSRLAITGSLGGSLTDDLLRSRKAASWSTPRSDPSETWMTVSDETIGPSSARLE